MRVLFVCQGNTCRSPMAKVIFEQILKQRGLGSKISVDSAAKGYPSDSTANPKAQKAIIELYGSDLLEGHIPKSIESLDLDDFELIITMDDYLKRDLPPEKTYTLREYAGQNGRIDDPIGGDLNVYIKCRDDIRDCLERMIERILKERSRWQPSV